MTAVSADKLTVQYDDRVILDRLSFSIPAGSITAIIGPNGSGKTTLLKALLGLIPYQGTVQILGESSYRMRSHIGYVPQRFTFEKTFPITVHEFMSLALPKKKKQNEVAIAAQLREVAMHQTKNELLGTLSGGQVQRILIARSLLTEPKIVFLDEAAAGIDIKGERGFYDLLKHLNHDHNMTIVFISHEVDIVHRYATQVLCLNKKMICIGKPTQVLTDQTLKELYDVNISLYSHNTDKHA